jgi:hypothetical protein
MRWGRIIAGAFLLEILLIVALVPPLQIFGPEKVIPLATPAVFVFGFGVAWWLLRNIKHQTVLHGALIGILATAIYLGLCFANPDGIQSVVKMYGLTQFVIGNAMRIVGCMVGAYVRSVVKKN